MKKIFLLIPAVAFALSLKSQNYQAVRSDRIVLFDNKSTGYIDHTLKVDSIKMEGKDSVFYLPKDLRRLTYNCISPFQPGFMGEKMLQKKNGVDVFFNFHNDSIKVNTLALLNDEWEFLKNKDYTVTAKVESFGVMDFLDILDSVKTIAIKVYDKNNVELTQYSSMKIKLSKNHGVISTFNLAAFPDMKNDLEYGGFTEGDARGMNSPELGIQNTTWRETFSHEIGDEFQTQTDHYPDFGDPVHIWTKYIILDKHDYGDSISYKYSRLIHKVEGDLIQKVTFKADTINRTHFWKQVFDNLPGEINVDTMNKYPSVTLTWIKEIKYDNGTSLFGKYFAAGYSPANDSCWFTIADGETIIFAPGLETYTQVYMVHYNESPVYLKTAKTEWGKAHDFSVGIGEISLMMMNVTPNPASDHLVFSSEEKVLPCTLNIYDLTGKLVDQQIISGTTYIYKNEKNLNGIYFCKLSSTQQSQSFKVVFQ